MTKIKLYNSMTRKKEIFTPIEGGLVKMYSCGPTLYDNVHIGNLRSFIVADTLQRMLRDVGGYNLRWIMNITDVDDKIIARAQQKYPDDDPKDALKKLSGKYKEKFLDDLGDVGIDVTEIFILAHATDYLDKMRDLIIGLYDKNIAYIVDGSIYFSLEEYAKQGGKYGVLAPISKVTQARIDDQDQKQGVGDFALWKAKKNNEPSWDFELDGNNYPGRPGWHIECSAMSTELLGDEFDIHTGGIDLKFPHHENEIAQCGGRLARFWVHNEHLTIKSSKMAKSVGNQLKLDAVSDPLAFRLMVLSAHYRSQMDYSEEGLLSAQSRLVRLREWASKVVNNPQAGSSPHLATLFEDFDEALADDMNTPQALSVLAKIEGSGERGEDVYAFILHADRVLGLHLLEVLERVRSHEEIDVLLARREKARAEQDFAQSDSLRDQLRDLGVGVEDTADGQLVWQLF